MKKYISIMLKPASSLCNLKCRYCFYADVSENRMERSYGIMSQDTMKQVIDNTFAGLSKGDQLTLAFQGGEPTLAGYPFFLSLTEYVNNKRISKDVSLSYVIQTNGISLTDDWCKLFKKYNFLVGISLDLHRGCHDKVRVDAHGNPTFDKVVDGIILLEKHGVDYNVLCTLTEELSQYPRKVWDMIVKYDFKYVQFTPCMGGLECAGSYALSPDRFAKFYKDIFDYWYCDFVNGKRRSIKLFDDVANLFLYNIRTACGIDGKCSPQLIVEADGSTYPCDFYCLDQFKLGNMTTDSMSDLYVRSMQSETKKREPLSEYCHKCNYNNMCGGGCKRMQQNICFIDKNAKYCGYKDLLDHMLPKINKLR